MPRSLLKDGGPPASVDEGHDNFAANAEEKPVTVTEHVGVHSRERFKIVGFTPAAGEDARECSEGKNWYVPRPMVVNVATSLLCLTVALDSSIITRDMAGPTKEFGTTQEIVNLTVTSPSFTYPPHLDDSPSPMFLALSEIFGRSLMYRVSMFIFFVLTLPSAFFNNIATLVAARQIVGIPANAPVTNVGGSIADLWEVTDVGACRERKAAKLRKGTEDETYQTPEELEHLPFKDTLKNALYRPIVKLINEPIVI
ncbi:hypothetical protein DFP72DRAFT_1063849 [Ephemerocybe angulata]|uniref:Uncharacterized protein n=1 Tax=Ephemerocybe angulata TaxID=980116 RepID=A0A8H6MB52_9AGAR|nr:hypothetical protein DFP72DRAFT_1063849 [Tulosesus angulatus]